MKAVCVGGEYSMWGNKSLARSNTTIFAASINPALSFNFCAKVSLAKLSMVGNHWRYLVTMSHHWKPPRYAKPNTTKIPFLFQSISSNIFPSATTCATRSAADVLPVATMSWNANGFFWGKDVMLDEEPLLLDLEDNRVVVLP